MLKMYFTFLNIMNKKPFITFIFGSMRFKSVHLRGNIYNA